MLYRHSVVGVNTYSIDTKWAAGYNPPLRSGRRTMIGEPINDKWFMVSIFYIHSVVGGVVNYNYVIYGVRTSLLLSS